MFSVKSEHTQTHQWGGHPAHSLAILKRLCGFWSTTLVQSEIPQIFDRLLNLMQLCSPHFLMVYLALSAGRNLNLFSTFV